MDNGLIPEHSIISNVYLPFIEVTSVNGMTGDVVVSLTLEDFKVNTFYKKGTAILHNGSLYYAKADFTSGDTFNPSDWDAPTFAQEQADWTENDNTKNSYIKNKPNLATVATTGAYSDLSGTPNLATVATSGAYSDLSGTPSLATVATSGSYADLLNIPANIVTDANYVHTDENYTSAEKTKLGNITTLALLDIFYPVGSYYETSDATFNPNTAWVGSTWVEEDSGRVLVSKTSSGDMDTVGATGGSATHRHDFKIGYLRWYGDIVGGENDETTWGAWSYANSAYSKNYGTESGGSDTHRRNSALQTSTTDFQESTKYSIGDTDTASSYQPWLVVKRWHRTA